MSKNSIAGGRDFHLYKECCNENFIYLEIEDANFIACKNRVIVAIPIEKWEVIRQYQGADLSFADRTDEEIVRYVNEEYKEVEEWKQTSEGEKESIKRGVSLWELKTYGRNDLPKPQRIKTGIAYYMQIRAQQNKVRQEIAKLKQEVDSFAV